MVLKAAGFFAAMSAIGIPTTRQATAQSGGTLAGTWIEAENVGGFTATQDASVFQADFPFYAAAPHWHGDAGPGLVEMSFSADGVSYTEPILVGQAIADAGPDDRDGRAFGELVFTDASSFIQYRPLDVDGNPTQLAGLAFTYIDATGGPTVDDVFAAAVAPSIDRPPVVSRAQWGAGLAYGGTDQAPSRWSPSYRTVEHVIIHHTVTPNFQSPLVAMRSIHYYHAITRGWGDIGYNYLVDYLGNVYEGRYGGENVIAGHAFQYSRGSAGIATIGTFSFNSATADAQAALIWITAWAGRN
ncbi:MAG: N-acetylmuramoyl-L-alanine amidase, partial [Chloroflexota bacterium]|nr:N-acetylmuramoyl-L-alanine amidase [Chloroflexota bacterium]